VSSLVSRWIGDKQTIIKKEDRQSVVHYLTKESQTDNLYLCDVNEISTSMMLTKAKFLIDVSYRTTYMYGQTVTTDRYNAQNGLTFNV